MSVLSFLLIGICLCISGVVSHCPRDNSRRVRNFFSSDVFPVLGTTPADLPKSCALHPDFDMYKVHEDHKVFDHNSDWRCQYCNKRFVSEKYLDRHMERTHSNWIPANATVCLSDYSKMLGFQPLQEEKLITGRVSPVQNTYNKLKKTFGALEKCSPTEVKELIQKCRDLSESCFPNMDNGDRSSSQLQFNALVCNNLKCVNGILKGGLHRDPEQDVFVSTIMRVLIILVIIGIVALQVCTTDSIFHNVRMRWMNKGKRDEDYLRKYQTNSQKYGWFVVTIVDAFYTMRNTMVGALKPAGKRD